MKKIVLFICFAVLSVHAQKREPTGIRMENILYPFPVKMLALTLQEQPVEMAYMDVRPEKSNGKTVLLLHGKNFSALYWEQTARDLAKSGYRVVMPDQIGFGKSSKPELQYTFQMLAQNTRKLLEALKIAKVSVLGHSMGGMLATRFALMYPDMTDKLILENPIGLEDWKTVVPYSSVDDWFASERAQNYDKMKAYQQEFYYGGQWKPEYEKWLIAPAGWTLHPDYRIIAKASALTYDMIFTQPVVYELDRLSVPTLLIIGQRDRTALGKARAPESVRESLGNYPALGKFAAQKIGGAQLVELDNVGHLPHIEAYDRFIGPLLAFLQK